MQEADNKNQKVDGETREEDETQSIIKKKHIDIFKKNFNVSVCNDLDYNFGRLKKKTNKIHFYRTGQEKQKKL